MFRWEHLDEGRALIHCDVDEWSFSVAKELDKEANDLMDSLAAKGYRELFAVGPNPRFCEYMGGECLGWAKIDGVEYWGYRWVLE
jgi:hypothetical protein